MSGTPLRIGAHQSIAGGLSKSVLRAVDIGANCLQIFSSAPQRWDTVAHSEEEIKAFRHNSQTHDVHPIYIHAKYLVNLATDNAFLLEKSISAVIADMVLAQKIGAVGVIVHFGSHPLLWAGLKRKTYGQIIRQILRETPGDAKFLFENSAGGGTTIGTTLTELGMIAQDLPESRVGFCLDTCHAFAMGYDLRTPQTVAEFSKEVERTISWNRVYAIHANDSMGELGNKKDRHDNIGKGKIGEEGFKAILHEEHFRQKPFLLETPGVDRLGPDKENIDTLKRLAE